MVDKPAFVSVITDRNLKENSSNLWVFKACYTCYYIFLEVSAPLCRASALTCSV